MSSSDEIAPLLREAIATASATTSQLKPKEPRSEFLKRLIAVSAVWVGIQALTSMQFGLSAPMFLYELRLEKAKIGEILAVVGPISLLIVQPLIGIASDSCVSKIGRRRPFILTGAVGAAAGSLVIAFAVDIGVALGDNRDGAHGSQHVAGIVTMTAGLLVMNVMLSVCQGPARAIVADVFDRERHQDANAMISGTMAFSSIVANVIAGLIFFSRRPYRTMFIIGSGAMLIGVAPTVIFVKEQPISAPVIEKVHKRDCCEAVLRRFDGLRRINKRHAMIWVTFFFSWASYTPSQFFLTSWFSENIFGGGEASDQGIRVSLLATAFFAVCQWLTSLAIPVLVRRSSPGTVHALTNLAAALSNFGFYFLGRAKPSVAISVAFVLTGLIGVNFSVMNSVPFALVSSLAGADAALFVALLNLPSMLSQTITMLLGSMALKMTSQTILSGSEGETTRQDVAVTFLIGSAFGLAASLASVFLPQPGASSSDTESTERLDRPVPIQSEDSGSDIRW